MPVAVQNLQDGPAVFVSKTRDGQEELVWQGRGDKNHEDIQYVHEDVIQNPKFQSLIRRQVFVLLDAEEADRKLAEKERIVMNSGVAMPPGMTETSVVNKPRTAAVAFECVGLIGSGDQTRQCGVMVRVDPDNMYATPPLCGDHQHQTGLFTLTEGEENPDTGRKTKRWAATRTG